MTDQDKITRDMLRDMLSRNLACTESHEFAAIILPELRVMLKETSVNFKHMCDLQVKIIAATKAVAAKQEAKLWIEETERQHVEMRRILLARIYQLEQADNSVRRQDSEILRRPPTPAVSTEGLGQFDGTHANWPQFRDLFIALVGSRELPNLNKLLILKGACKGPAALAIRGYEPLEDCYEAAWNALKAIYEDNYAVVQALIDRLINMPAARNIEVEELRRIIDTTTSTLRQLTGLGEDVQTWDAVIINLITKKLPFAIIESWEQTRKRDQRPTLNELLAFIDARARARMFNLESSTSASSRGKPNSKILENNFYRQSGIPRYRSPRKNLYPPNNRNYEANMRCRQCGKGHRLGNCPILLGKSIPDRKNLIIKLGVCLNCLGFGHYSAQCNRPGCTKRGCNYEKHHWILCLNANFKAEAPKVGVIANKKVRKD